MVKLSWSVKREANGDTTAKPHPTPNGHSMPLSNSMKHKLFLTCRQLLVDKDFCLDSFNGSRC